MSKPRPAFACTDCGHRSTRWFGRCPDCGAWSSAGAGQESPASAAVALGDAAEGESRLSTGIGEVDRVLGGGLVGGAVVLLAGEPGIGKSTLVLQLLDGLLSSRVPSLLVSGEESIAQIGLRARRLGLDLGRVRALATTQLPDVLTAATAEQPRVLVVDSIQTLVDPETDSVPGAPLQVRACTQELVRLAKNGGLTVVLVGHVTKDGSVAGPKTLEHVVDVVLTLDGERTGSMRLLRAVKNRFGSSEETGVFVMRQEGLEAVPDPSALLLADRHPGVSGSVVFPGIEGTRPVLVELQALVTKSDYSQARRVPTGLDARRLALLIGALGEHADVKLKDCDVFAAAAGGIAVREPAADLPLCLAIASSLNRVPVDSSCVALGEVGLGGEVRRVSSVERRLAEASRHGFRRALVPPGCERAPQGIDVVEVRNLAEALSVLKIATPRRATLV